MRTSTIATLLAAAFAANACGTARSSGTLSDSGTWGGEAGYGGMGLGGSIGSGGFAGVGGGLPGLGGGSGRAGGAGSGGVADAGPASGRWTIYTDKETGLDPNVGAFEKAEGPPGTYWFAAECAGIVKFDGKAWTLLSVASVGGNVCTKNISVDPQGLVWVGTNFMLLSYDGIAFTQVVPPSTSRANTVYYSMLMTTAGVLYVAGSWSGETVVSMLEGGAWTSFVRSKTPGWPSMITPQHLALVGDTLWMAGDEVIATLSPKTNTAAAPTGVPMPGQYYAGLGLTPTGELAATLGAGNKDVASKQDGALFTYDGARYTTVNLPAGAIQTHPGGPTDAAVDRAGRVWVSIPGQGPKCLHVYDHGVWDPPALKGIIDSGPTSAGQLFID
jgi:hypothetical protein